MEQDQQMTKAEEEDACETMGLKEFRDLRAIVLQCSAVDASIARKLLKEVDALRVRVKASDDRAFKVLHHLGQAMREATR